MQYGGIEMLILAPVQGRGAWRTDPVSAGPVPNTTYTIHSAVRPHGISNVTAYEVSLVDSWSSVNGWSVVSGSDCISQSGVLSQNASTASQCYRPMRVPSSGTIDFVKYVGIASSDAYKGKELETALGSAKHANQTGYDSLLKSHQSAWAAVWNDADIIIPGEEHTELQIATRASMFNLIANVSHDLSAFAWMALLTRSAPPGPERQRAARPRRQLDRARRSHVRLVCWTGESLSWLVRRAVLT